MLIIAGGLDESKKLNGESMTAGSLVGETPVVLVGMLEMFWN